MERLTEKEPNWIDDELYMSACEPDDETVDAIYIKLKAYEDTGLEPEEIMHLVELKQQGRLIELPCKVGESAYSLLSPPHYKRGKIYEYNVVFIGINDSEDMGCGLFNARSVKGDWMYSFNFSEIGKTVFLTKEEAEQALSK